MEKFKFQTNINCNGCLSAVKPFLDGEKRIEKWEVDLLSDNKILTIEASGITSVEIKDIIGEAGFEAREV